MKMKKAKPWKPGMTDANRAALMFCEFMRWAYGIETADIEDMMHFRKVHQKKETTLIRLPMITVDKKPIEFVQGLKKVEVA